MAIQKKEYELSIWDEILDSDGKKIEAKSFIIGAHDMTYLGRATSIKLERDIKGTNTLTFSMPQKFFDPEKGEFVKNEFIDSMYNERKVKLKYDGKWFEFYIKKISEAKKFKSIVKTFTCEDSFIDELSRTGYEINFSTELYNSVNEIGDFMDDITDKSIWDYTPKYNSGDFTEYKETRFYKVPLSQFGGELYAYPIDLTVTLDDIKKTSPWYKEKKESYGRDLTDEELEDELELINVYTKDKRTIEYGDDLAREIGLFWDNYLYDNGTTLLDDERLVSIKGDYIYVPISDLSMISGSIYNNAKKAVESPALYGAYTDEEKKGYALQPYSENPEDLIQFIFFNDGDTYKIDESGILANNDCHYVIKIQQWNEKLEQILSSKSDIGVVYWTSPNYDEDSTYSLTTKYTCKDSEDGQTKYTVGVMPQTRTIDEFVWYPIYYDGYLTEVGGDEVSEARKLSITDRTEYNKNEDSYVTVYKQSAGEFKGLYSEEELEKLVPEVGDEDAAESAGLVNFRISSKLDTKQVLPSLAKNLIENGTEITKDTGWEAKTQNMNDSGTSGTGSYYKLMELSVQSTVKSLDEDEDDDDSDSVGTVATSASYTGATSDEAVSDYYLEILSPYMEKSSDLSKLGSVESDYVVNFGIVGQEKKIEKDKVYAIRLKTGSWSTTSYRIVCRRTGEYYSSNYKEATVNSYKTEFQNFKKYIDSLKSNTDFIAVGEAAKATNTLTDETEKQEARLEIDEALIELMENQIATHDAEIDTEALKWKNMLIMPDYDEDDTYTIKEQNIAASDIGYLKYALFESANCTLSSTYSDEFYNVTKLTQPVLNNLIDVSIYENQKFEKSLNEDLDKIVIGEGSIDSSGNYVIDGTEKGDSAELGQKFISFNDLFERQSNALRFVPSNTGTSGWLTKTIYNVADEADKKTWSISTTGEGHDYSIEDNAFLLFKAKETIENPYVAIRVDSGVAQLEFSQIDEMHYLLNDGRGIKIDVIAPDSALASTALSIARENYNFVDNVLIEVYQVSYSNFSTDFLKSIGFSESLGTVVISDAEEVEGREFGELKEGDLVASTDPWSTYSSVTDPVYYSNVLPSNSDKKSVPYALFINSVYYGLFWLEVKSGIKTTDTEASTTDEEEDESDGGES